MAKTAIATPGGRHVGCEPGIRTDQDVLRNVQGDLASVTGTHIVFETIHNGTRRS